MERLRSAFFGELGLIPGPDDEATHFLEIGGRTAKCATVETHVLHCPPGRKCLSLMEYIPERAANRSGEDPPKN